MTLSPGDTIQIILTVGGVPYAKTWAARCEWSQQASSVMLRSIYEDLCNDIDLYANETESTNEEAR